MLSDKTVSSQNLLLNIFNTLANPSSSGNATQDIIELVKTQYLKPGESFTDCLDRLAKEQGFKPLVGSVLALPTSSPLPANNKEYVPLYYPGDNYVNAFKSKKGKLIYVSSCEEVANVLKKMLLQPCDDYKKLLDEILNKLSEEASKIARKNHWRDDYGARRTEQDSQELFNQILNNEYEDHTRLSVTKLAEDWQRKIKEEIVTPSYREMATVLKSGETGKIATPEKGVREIILEQDETRYRFTEYSQVEVTFKNLKTMKSEKLPIGKAIERAKKINLSNYELMPHYNIPENYEDTFFEFFKGYSFKDILVGQVEWKLGENFWIPLSGHITARNGDSWNLSQEKLPVFIINPDAGFVENVLEKMAILLQKVVKWNKKDVSELHEQIAKIIFFFVQGKLFQHANDHAMRIFISACYKMHGIQLTKTEDLAKLFIEAMYQPWLNKFVLHAKLILDQSILPMKKANKKRRTKHKKKAIANTSEITESCLEGGNSLDLASKLADSEKDKNQLKGTKSENQIIEVESVSRATEEYSSSSTKSSSLENWVKSVPAQYNAVAFWSTVKNVDETKVDLQLLQHYRQ